MQLCAGLRIRHELHWVSSGKSNPIRNALKFEPTIFIFHLSHDDAHLWDFLGEECSLVQSFAAAEATHEPQYF